MLSPNCPNHFPDLFAGARRLALIGDCPSTHDRSRAFCPSCRTVALSELRDTSGNKTSLDRCMRCGTPLVNAPMPFSGPAGALLDRLLDRVGLRRQDCFLGNVCQVTPPRGEINRYKWAGPEIQGGLALLRADLQRFDPHMIVCLGQAPLRAIRDGKGALEEWRGYLFTSNFLAPPLAERASGEPCGAGDKEQGRRDVKCLATFHPALLLKTPASYEATLAEFDLKRAAREMRTDTIERPTLTLHTQDTCASLLLRLSLVKQRQQPVAYDIEGGCGGIACVGFATSATEAFVVPFTTVEGASVWCAEEELALWEAVASVLEDDAVPKLIQNALYELFVLAWVMGIVIRNVRDDIMIKHFELYCELPKSLEFQASFYTSHPFWKLSHRRDKHTGLYRPYKDGKPATSDEWYRYNATDCCVTFACHEAQERQLKPRQRAHYEENMKVLAPILYMMLRGFRYDYENAKKHRKSVEKKIYALQDRINRECAITRLELGAFFAALECQLGDGLRRAENNASDFPVSARGGATIPLSILGQTGLDMLTDAFCLARRAIKQTVEEVSWQPMQLDKRGKRWVKGGKRVAEIVTPNSVCVDELPVAGGPDMLRCNYYVRHIKQVEKSVTQPISSAADILTWCKPSLKREARRSLAILKVATRQGFWLPAQRGELATLLGVSLKIRASGRDKDEIGEGGELERGDERDANWFLYEHCALPKQYVKEGNAFTDRLASDDQGVLKAWSAGGKDRRAIWFLALKRLMTMKKFYEANTDDDGRMRFSLNLVGTPTARMAAYGSPTGSSPLNPQTIPKKARVLYTADEGCELSQFDLDGSDSYTVAAYCASLGDRTMLDDNLNRIKPAKVLARIYETGPGVNSLSRDALKAECKKVAGEGWLYFACKRVLHGSNYGMGKATMAAQILTDSYKLTGKPIHLTEKTCLDIQTKAFFVRYPGVKRWHRWMEEELRTKGVLTACNGFTRRFYGRKDSHDTTKAALAHTPQVLTTYAIVRTLLCMWTDPDNSNPDGTLKVEPLLCVHDSIVSQWRREHREFARAKFKQWFAHTLSVNGIEFVIPANGTCGSNWLHQGEEKWKSEGGVDL